MACLFSPHASRRTLSALLALIAALSAVPLSTARAASAAAVPAPRVDAPKVAGPPQTAVLAGGCFWGVQGVFEHLTGVRRVVAGYSGGARTTAHYELVGTGGTGHAESVEITYDPQLVSYGEILQVFFSVAHDPTQLNRQGPDSGSQYRSVIFYADANQQRIATQYIAQLNQLGVFRAPIATRVDPFQGFFAAEDYHQDFLLHHPGNPYIVFNDLPKIQNFQKVLPALYTGTPVTLAAR
jgi:peptide-methionine (S)-S-oxide reductase